MHRTPKYALLQIIKAHAIDRRRFPTNIDTLTQQEQVEYCNLRAMKRQALGLQLHKYSVLQIQTVLNLLSKDMLKTG